MSSEDRALAALLLSLAACCAACRCGQPPPVMDVPVIDVHAHTFNARYLPLEGILAAHAEAQGVSLGSKAGALARLLWDLTEGSARHGLREDAGELPAPAPGEPGVQLTEEERALLRGIFLEAPRAKAYRSPIESDEELLATTLESLGFLRLAFAHAGGYEASFDAETWETAFDPASAGRNAGPSKSFPQRVWELCVTYPNVHACFGSGALAPPVRPDPPRRARGGPHALLRGQRRPLSAACRPRRQCRPLRGAARDDRPRARGAGRCGQPRGTPAPPSPGLRGRRPAHRARSLTASRARPLRRGRARRGSHALQGAGRRKQSW